MAFSLVRSRHVLGNLIFYEEGFEQRWIDAIGPNVVKFVDDFAACLFDTAWETTLVEAGTGESLILPYDGEGGLANFSPADANSDAIQIQSSNEGFKLTPNDPCYFGARWMVHGVVAAGSFVVFIGLSNKDTTLLSGGSSHMGFSTSAGSNALIFSCSKAATLTAVAMVTSLTADVFHITECYWDGTSKIYSWIDGVANTTHTSMIPTAQTLAVSISVTNNGANDGTGAASNAMGLVVDYVRAIQLLASR